MNIQNQNFMITGANRGIGRAVALAAARKNAKLHLVIRQADASLVRDLQIAGAQSVTVWLADLSARAGVQSLLNELGEQPIDILFNNAGLLTGGLLEEQPLNEIYPMLQVNIAAVIHLTQGLLPGMLARRRGKIINNSSVSALMHFPCASTYAASKAAVMAFTNCLDLELKGTGVSTLCLITPGIKTRMFDEIETKYAKNFEIPTDSISAEDYAVTILKAIEADLTMLLPKGTTGMALSVARFLPKAFRQVVGRRFHRES